MPVIDRINVLILHGDPIAQTGLHVALGRYPDLEVQDMEGFVFSREGLLMPQPWQLHADVVVADYFHGVALAGAARRDSGSAGKPRIVVVAGIDREWEIKSALESGVMGYLPVGCAFDEIATGVRSVHAGVRHLGTQVSDRLVESMFIEALTAREQDVMRLVIEGLCNKAIGRGLGIAEGTVKSHLKSAFDKLGVRNRTQAVGTVERRGLLRRESARGAQTLSPRSHLLEVQSHGSEDVAGNDARQVA